MAGSYRSNGSIADLMLQRGRAGAEAVRNNGRAAAQAQMVSGNAWGNAIQNIGQAASGTLRDIAQQKADAPNRELRQRQSDMLAKELSAMDTATAQAEIGRLAGMVKASGYDPSTAEPLFRAMGRITPDYAEPLLRSLMDPAMLKNVTDTLITQVPGYKPPEGFALSEGQTRFGPDGTPIASVPKPPPVEQPFTLGEGQVRYNPDGSIAASGPPKPVPVPPREPNPTEASLAMAAASGDPNALKALNLLRAQRPTAVDNEPLVAVIGDDGNPVLLPRSQAKGRRPASNREQGRAVTSGDAGRIAELDTSLDDLGVLGGALASAGSTGTAAKVGASVPNWVTEFTGWGSDAKKKQALIDRVKQVIGKALEGGVLRKEDELKYEKILPTVGDPNDLVLSKLTGLGNAIKLRRTRTIESLADAGYDTSRFTARDTQPKAQDTVDALIKKYGGG